MILAVVDARKISVRPKMGWDCLFDSRLAEMKLGWDGDEWRKDRRH